MLSLAGVPGIYIHSLFGSRNCISCVNDTGRARSINREKFDYNKLRSILDDHENIHTKVFLGYKELLKIRRNQPAFHPGAPQRVLKSNQHVFTILRSDLNQRTHILCLVNVSSENQEVMIDLISLGIPYADSFLDLLDVKSHPSDKGQITLVMEAFQIMWLMVENPPSLN